MNQYIITEEQLKKITQFGGVEKLCIDSLRQQLADEIRSHPYQSKQKGQICIHCEVRNDVQFCHFHDVPIKSERDKVLDGRKLYQCNSDTCSDSGGVCILCIPDMDFSPPTSCVNPEAFTDNGDEPDCKWEELRQQAGEQK
jgi:hypothetical protein